MDAHTDLARALRAAGRVLTIDEVEELCGEIVGELAEEEERRYAAAHPAPVTMADFCPGAGYDDDDPGPEGIY